MAAAAGYSGTPLATKLSLKPGLKVWFQAMPDSVRAELAESGVAEQEALEAGVEVVHLFTAQRSELERMLPLLRQTIAMHGFVWISWPKKASKVPTDIAEDTIRELCLPLGFVDVKVCAIDAVWSGLKLMIRKDQRVKDRPKTRR